MQQKTSPGDSTKTKPDGGYILISALSLGLLWWSYTQGLIGLRAVRVYLALFEMRIRRVAHVLAMRKKGIRTDFEPHFSPKELGEICGLPTKRVKAALEQLLKIGLILEFSESQIRFARSLFDLNLNDQQRAEFQRWFPLLTKRTQVPFPRRILVLAAESSGPALIAVILGACLRCCWRKDGVFTYSGRLSCTWLARRFGLSLRAIRAAKEHLVDLGWIQKGTSISRFGELVTLNPEWHRLITLPASQREKREDQRAGEETPPPLQETQPPPPSGTKSAGSEPQTGTKSAGVSLIRESLPTEESKYQRESPRPQNPETIRLGICEEASRKEEKTPSPPQKETPLPAPRLSKIIAEDFKDTGRALELFRQAVKCGLITDSEHSRLLWMTAIERARTTDARNPAGVFLFLVKNRKWDFLSDGHYDAANRRLKEYLYAPPAEVPAVLAPLLFRPVPLSASPPARPPLSKDALLVKVVRNELAKRGGGGSVFAALRAHAGFTQERYRNAVAELENREIISASLV